MYVALVELDVFSGVSIFLPGTSSSAPVYPLPPPTSVVGALSYPFMRQFAKEDDGGYSASVKLLDFIKYASAGARGYVITRDSERIYQLIYQRKQRWSEEFLDLWYTVAPRGCVKYTDDTLYLFFVSNDRNILDYSYGITRVGRKESHAVVKRVVIKNIDDALIPHPEGFNTIFYTPKNIAECESKFMSLPVLDRANYTSTVKPITEEFYIPNKPEGMYCRAKSECAVVNIDELYIAIPRKILPSKTR